MGMENILIFVITVIIYSIGYDFVSFLITGNCPTLTKFSKIMAIMTLLALPLNIGGNVFTIAGNAVAEKNVFSVFSVYQKAERDTITFANIGYQRAGGIAFTFLGITYQNGGQDAATIIGLAGYQWAGRDAIKVIGLAGYQWAGRDAVNIVGLAGYQKARERAYAYAAITLYQRVGEKTRAFGAFSSLTKD